MVIVACVDYLCTEINSTDQSKSIISMKQPAKIDVAVLVLFFNRPDHFQQVFDEVKKARPSRLFLYQDGARGERDVPGIEACRQIVSDENID